MRKGVVPAWKTGRETGVRKHWFGSSLKARLSFLKKSFCRCSMCGQCPWRPEGNLDSLELELQAVVSCTTWVPGTDLGSSVGSESALNGQAALQSPKSQTS